MLTCKELSRIVASDELPAAGWKTRLAVRFHLLVCRHCRRYVSQMQAIGVAAKEIFDTKEDDLLSRHQLRDSILDEIPPKKKN